MGKLFGTDGIRGVANKELSVDLAMEVAQAAGTVIKEKIGRKPRFVIGRDTRLSSSMLESAMAAGLCSVGCDVQMLGVVPTPAVAYLVRKLEADPSYFLRHGSPHRQSRRHHQYGFRGDHAHRFP